MSTLTVVVALAMVQKNSMTWSGWIWKLYLEKGCRLMIYFKSIQLVCKSIFSVILWYNQRWLSMTWCEVGNYNNIFKHKLSARRKRYPQVTSFTGNLRHGSRKYQKYIFFSYMFHLRLSLRSWCGEDEKIIHVNHLYYKIEANSDSQYPSNKCHPFGITFTNWCNTDGFSAYANGVIPSVLDRHLAPQLVKTNIVLRINVCHYMISFFFF